MPIINPIWFYLSELCGNIKFISTMIIIVFGIAFIVMGIAYFVAEDEFENIQKFCHNGIKKCISFLLPALIISIICPDEETVTKMVVASIITKENIEYTKEEIIDIVEEINDIINNHSNNTSDNNSKNNQFTE